MTFHLTPHAGRFATLALRNVTRPYPVQPMHLISGPDDLAPPTTHHPAFYGAYDWHSAVHMHWLLARLLRRYPNAVDRAALKHVLDSHLTRENLQTEADYLRAHPSFERPYGWAWLIALTAECQALADDAAHEEDSAHGRAWSDALAPAARSTADLLESWLGKATYPVRHGVHSNSAFALGLVLDSAHSARQTQLLAPVTEKLLTWFGDDHAAPVHWEPSGQDFLSPTLTEADAMRRILSAEQFPAWLRRFLPGLDQHDATAFLHPPVISDPSDPQIGHLLGLCLSRAAALRALAAALPSEDPRRTVLTEAAGAHLDAGLPRTVSGDFTTDHWLATFAALALDGPPAHASPSPR